MSDATDARTANLLGALVLVAAERVETATSAASGRPASDTAALVALTTTLGGASQDRLAHVLGLTQSGATRLVDRLAQEGLAERRRGPDGRTSAVVATATGERTARQALRERLAVTQGLLAVLRDDERAQLTRLLERLLGGVTGGRDDAYRICRLCDPDACGHAAGRCPVTTAADAAERPRT